MLTLRDAESSDFERILRLETQTRRAQVRLAGQAWDAFEQRQRVAQNFARHTTQMVWRGEQQLGTVAVNWDAEPVELVSLALEADFRGMGVGTQLVARIVAQAADQGRNVAVTLPCASPAELFFTKLGFKAQHDPSDCTRLLWAKGERSQAALDWALQPWTDTVRCDAWLAGCFEHVPTQQTSFLEFVLGRIGAQPSTRALAYCGSPVLPLETLALKLNLVDAVVPDALEYKVVARRAASLGLSLELHAHLPACTNYALIVGYDGPFCAAATPAARARMASEFAGRLSPGGILLLDEPHVPWLLANELHPTPKTRGFARGQVTQIIDREPALHTGGLLHKEERIVNVAEREVLSRKYARTLYLVTRPELVETLEHAGFHDVQTFANWNACSIGRAETRRLLVVARKG